MDANPKKQSSHLQPLELQEKRYTKKSRTPQKGVQNPKTVCGRPRKWCKPRKWHADPTNGVRIPTYDVRTTHTPHPKGLVQYFTLFSFLTNVVLFTKLKVSNLEASVRPRLNSTGSGCELRFPRTSPATHQKIQRSCF